MIYFDNAATTARKPPQVAEAVARAIDGFGGVGRGVHEASLDAGLTVYRTRCQIARLFGGPDASRVAFTSNVTEALNIAIDGLVQPGQHAVTTAASHNAVLRPLYRKEDEGCSLSIVPVAPDGSVDYDAFEAAFHPETRLVALTHASNVTGDVYDIVRMARIGHDHGALVLVDVAQTAGVIPIDMASENLDIIAFTGHKSLYGPQGTGGLCVAEGIDIPPLCVGGTGMHSYDRHHPSRMPESLEAGTLNAHGIAGLGAGIAFVEERGTLGIAAEVASLTQRFEQGVRRVPGVRVYGGGGDAGRCGVVALNVYDYDSAAISDALNVDYGICTRAGAHCAPLMHEALGTQNQGVVRFSFSCFNTVEEVDIGIRAVVELAREE